jgi:DNA polymerase-1
LGVDTETRDDSLSKDQGPGWSKRDGFLAGISLHHADSAFSGYYPVAHLEGGNLDRGLVFSYFRELLARPDLKIVFMNSAYDLGWLSTEGIEVHGQIIDIQTVETLLDEEMSDYSLNGIALRRLGEGKDEAVLRETAAAYGVDPKADLWKIHAAYVGRYAEKDAELPVRILREQERLIQRDSLQSVFQLEADVAPICFAMARRGVRVDLDYADQLNKKWLKEETALDARLWAAGRIRAWEGASIAAYCDQEGISYPRTAGTNTRDPQPSFESAWLSRHPCPTLNLVHEARKINRLRSKFLETDIIKGSYRGRVHTQFVPTAREEGGARAGRMASQHPNLQQVPKRSEVAALIRRCFLPDDGCWWDNFDYDAQEPRIQVHYAALQKLGGVDKALDVYRQGKKIYNLIEQYARCDYDKAKTVFLAVSYNMTPPTLAESLQINLDEANEILERLYAAVPYLRELPRLVQSKAERTGAIRTLGGRLCHFDFWKPGWADKRTIPVKGLEAAKKKWGNCVLERQYGYKAFNRLIQGSAADQTKKALVAMAKSGIMPQLPVHDEINRSSNHEKEGRLQKEIMENVFHLEQIPVVAAWKRGPNWGECVPYATMERS